MHRDYTFQYFFGHISDNCIQSSSQLVQAVMLIFGIFNARFNSLFQPNACAQIGSGEFSLPLVHRMSEKEEQPGS